MRITLKPKNVEEKEPPFENKEVYRFAYEFSEGSGNIHITNTDMIVDIYETIGNDIIVWYEDNTKEIVENYKIVGIKDL
jgi:hypothetical protein